MLEVKLQEMVWKEAELCELLGIKKETLDGLRREKSFPVVRLTTLKRVYLASEVLKWLESHNSQK